MRSPLVPLLLAISALAGCTSGDSDTSPPSPSAVATVTTPVVSSTTTSTRPLSASDSPAPLTRIDLPGEVFIVQVGQYGTFRVEDECVVVEVYPGGRIHAVAVPDSFATKYADGEIRDFLYEGETVRVGDGEFYMLGGGEHDPDAFAYSVAPADGCPRPVYSLTRAQLINEETADTFCGMISAYIVELCEGRSGIPGPEQG